MSELVALKWEDITINRYDGVLEVISGKGGKKRLVPLNSKIRTVLSKYKEYMKKKHKNEKYLFFRTRGKINSDAVLRMFYALNKILIFKVTPHNLRHTFCKTLLAKGVDMSEIATMAGHSSLNVTQKYVTPSLADTVVSVEKLIDF